MCKKFRKVCRRIAGVSLIIGENRFTLRKDEMTTTTSAKRIQIAIISFIEWSIWMGELAQGRGEGLS